MKNRLERTRVQKKEIDRLPEKSGVYFLYQKGGILVYIGKALSLRTRVPQHDLNKEFEYIEYESCHWSRARQLEKDLLYGYEKKHAQLPFYNKQR